MRRNAQRPGLMLNENDPPDQQDPDDPVKAGSLPIEGGDEPLDPSNNDV